MPGFITEATNDWTVVAVDDSHCKLVMKAKFRTKGLMGTLMTGNMEKKMTGLLDTVLNDAKVYAETGYPSDEKLARMAQLDKKSKKAA